MNVELRAISEADGLDDASPMLRSMAAARKARRFRRTAWKPRTTTNRKA